MTKKISIAETIMRNKCCAIIKKAMNCENRKPDHVEMVRFLQRNLKNEALWIVMSGVLEGKQRFECLERALRINPQNESTFRLMKIVNHKRAYKVARELKLFDYSLKPQ
jgi:hypothetical protein